MPRTAKELSPEEWQQYRSRFDQYFQSRDPVDEALLCRAWKTARRVAVMLYENFGATQVAVFGSLAVLSQETGSEFAKPSRVSPCFYLYLR